MNWYKIAKNKSINEEFSYGDSIRTLWNNAVKMEQDRSKIYFDLENNDGYEFKTKNIPYKTKNHEYKVKANLCWAGGDWENPIAYFRCQFEVRSLYLDKWDNWKPHSKAIIIPVKSNLNLVKCEKGLCASSNNESRKNEIKDKDLWAEMIKIANERIKNFDLQEMDYNGDTRFENTGCTRDLTTLVRQK